MARKQVYSIKRVIKRDELEDRIKKVESEVRVLKRLYFIHHLYLGENIEEASEKVCISVPTGYEWLKRWNEGGYENLIPQFDGGAPGKLTSEQQKLLDQYIKDHDPITSKEEVVSQTPRNTLYRHISLQYAHLEKIGHPVMKPTGQI